MFNAGDAKAPIEFVKTHELEGEIVKVEKPKQPKVQPPATQKTGKKKNAKDSSSKSSKGGKKEKKKGGGGGKKAKHSMELTEDEEFSLNQHFKTRTGKKALSKPKNYVFALSFCRANLFSSRRSCYCRSKK